MHSTDSYLTYAGFSEALDRLCAEEESLDSVATTFRPKANAPTGVIDHLRTFGPKVQTGLPASKVTTSKVSTGRKKERSINKWLRNRTSGLDFGKEITGRNGKKHPIHINTNQEVLEFFNDLRRGRRSWLNKIKDQDFIDHRAGEETFYFAGNSRPQAPETLGLIDIDCKETGTLEGALAFAEFLKEQHFPNLYIEVSTHGNGAHGFFVLEKCGFGATLINDLLLHRLQSWLRQVLAEQEFDVENVEIKGTLPVVEWGDEKYEVLTYKSGTLAKLPRIGTPELEEQLRNTTVLTVDELQRLPCIEEDKRDSVVSIRINKSSSVAGSISGKHISDDELREVDGHYRVVAESLMEVHALKTSGKTVATVEDLAIFLMLLKFFTTHMNPDGSLPVQRWADMWRAVSQAGDINRCFCSQRFKTLRDHLSSLGLLEWKDEKFQIGWFDEDGEYRKGKACKWKASEELMAKLEIPVADVVVADNEEGRGGASFIRTDLIEFFKSITQQPKDDTVRPVLFDPESPLRLNPDEINRFIPPFEAYSGLAA